jgi:cysteinyl-tRNA synthetase
MMFKKIKKEYKQQNSEPIHLKNTMTNEVEIFKPLVSGEVKMYNCGPTVYSEQHIGNLYAAVFADVLRRMFEYNGYNVRQVINITDVGHLTSDADTGEDKMEKKAKEDGKKTTTIAQEITDIYLKDLKALGVDINKIQFPRATDYIDAQIELTKTLLEKGYAYVIDRGVAFDTSKFSDYGKLGNINIDELDAGSRVATDIQKRNPADFWLWKLSDKPVERQQEWESPWGVGFPGWHIECTAMSRALLGRQLDVHTGGIEHIPVHHNNEIAQSESLSGKKFVNYWMHNAHIMIDGKKISKSLGNVIYLRQIIDRGYSPLALRYLFLSSKYDSEQNFTWEALDASANALNKLRKYYADNLLQLESDEIDIDYSTRFTKAINDNLGTPRALATLWDLIKDDTVSLESKRATIESFDTVFGLHISANEQPKSNRKKLSTISSDVSDLLAERKKAREAKDWAKSDKLRDKLRAKGYEVTDTEGEQKLSTI